MLSLNKITRKTTQMKQSKNWPSPRLAAILQLKEMTIQTFARLMDMSYPNAHHVCTGRWTPGPKTRRRIAAALDIEERTIWPNIPTTPNEEFTA